MLVFRILSTVFVGLSVFTGLVKNIAFFKDSKNDLLNVSIWSIYSLAWRALVIVSIWII